MSSKEITEYNSIDDIPEWEEFTYDSYHLKRLNELAKEKGLAGNFVIIGTNISCTIEYQAEGPDKITYTCLPEIEWGWSSSEGFSSEYSYPKEAVAALEKYLDVLPPLNC